MLSPARKVAFLGGRARRDVGRRIRSGRIGADALHAETAAAERVGRASRGWDVGLNCAATVPSPWRERRAPARQASERHGGVDLG
jgi:hypothetical protein